MSDVHRSEGEPHDRLTRIGNRIGLQLEHDPEHVEGDRCVIFLSDGERAVFGYDSDNEAIVDMLMHLKAVFAANGKTLVIAPLRKG